MNKYRNYMSFLALALILFLSVGAVCATNDDVNGSISPQTSGGGEFLI